MWCSQSKHFPASDNYLGEKKKKLWAHNNLKLSFRNITGAAMNTNGIKEMAQQKLIVLY